MSAFACMHYCTKQARTARTTLDADMEDGTLSAVDVRMRAELANSDGVLDSPIEFSLGYSTPPLTLTLWLSERCEFARRRTGTFTCTRLHSLRHHARDAADEHKYGQRVRVNWTRART